MTSSISLFDLVNLSIGTPEIGAVNFNALHTLLHAILEHLKIQNVTAEWREPDVGPDPREALVAKTNIPGERPSLYHHMEDKLRHIENKIAALERLPSGKELLSRTASGTTTSVNDMWQLMQLRRKVEANEDGVSKCMELMQDLLKEIQELKETRDDLKKEVRALQSQLDQVDLDNLADGINVLKQNLHKLEDLENSMRELKEKVALYPHPEEFSHCVTWEDMQATLVNEREMLKKELKDSIKGTGSPVTPSEVPLTPRASSTVGLHGLADSSGSADPDLGGSQEVPLPQLPVSRVSSGAEHYPETVEALRDVGQLQERHERLEDRVELLERGKTDQAQVQQLREMLHDMGERSMHGNILEQVNDLKTLVDTLTANTEMVCSPKHLISDTPSVSVSRGVGEEVSELSLSCQGKGSVISTDQLLQQCLQIESLSKTVPKLEEEVELLKKGLIEVRIEKESSPDEHMRDQLDGLRSMLEDMMASSSTMLSWSLQQETQDVNQGRQDETLSQGQHWGQAAGQRSPQGPSGQAGPTSPSSMVDLSRKVSQLFQRYEKLHGMVTGFVKQQESDRTEHGFGISSEVMSDVQGAILQLQVECEKLHDTTSQLMEAHIQKQSHIDHLYKTMEELEEKKADREVVEMEIDIKADKRALETKVSRMQFDTMTEQLNGMFQDLLNKVVGREQDWNKVIEKISREMECKLNRIELDPLKKQLEDRWRSIHKQLQAQPAPEHDDAAGFKKQLVARFHCISCDRPVDMLTPGPLLVTVPSPPGLPSHKTNRPHTVYELEQVRQHSRSLRAGTKQGQYEGTWSDRSLAQMRCIHSMMCSQIDRVQRKFSLARTLEPFHGHGLQELTRFLHPPILGPLQRTRRSPPKHERIPEMADYGYLALSRSCGGSHTLTSTNRRYSRLQHIPHLIQTGEDSRALSSSGLQVQPEEVDILGLDGHIYKGRLNNRAVKTVESRLPTISPKEGNRTEPSCTSPLRPQSANTQGCQSVMSGFGKKWSMSSMSCLSQADETQFLEDSNHELLHGL